MRGAKRLLMIGIMGVAVGCGTAQRSVQFSDAAKAISSSQEGAGGEYAPGELESAKELFKKAEAAGPQSPEEVHFAYLAQRQAQVAESDGQRRKLKREVESAGDTRTAILEEARRKAEKRAEALEARIAALKADRERMQGRLVEVDRRLAKFVDVQSKKDRLILTINGSVLFGFDKAKLRPIAKTRLRQVAGVLEEQAPDRRIEVIGHTDSLGKEAYNEQLSLRRAEVVRAYLVRSGLSSSRVQAIGRGETEPVAPNDTAEGRASNRRVEIHVVNPATASAASLNTAAGR